MVSITVTYSGQLRCRAVHGPSGRDLITDAPVDNQGRGEAFSPTDLLATGLGTCMATIMGITAKRENWSLEGLGLQVDKHMTSAPPRRIARLVVQIIWPAHLDAAARATLEKAARGCPVLLSLHPDIVIEVSSR